MVSVVVVFLVALLVTLVSTPVVGAAAVKLRILDRPSERKVHQKAMPRAGGVAIFMGVVISMGAFLLYGSSLGSMIRLELSGVAFCVGGLVAFGLGLWDDVRRVPVRLKLGMQVVASLVAYAGGIKIGGILFPWGTELPLGWLSLPATVIWFVIIMNAINLIDGLDGLAAGVSFFVCTVLGVLCITTGRLLEAVGFAAVAGACLGFLRYNFNPASIFMGDSGSYLLGYVIAGMSVLGSLKSQTATALLIPIVALGVPLTDVFWATMRRFLLGQGIFKSDRDHLHHRLIKMGFTQRRAVLLIYGLTLLLGVVSLSFVYMRDFRAALVLLLVGAAAVIGIRKLGYLEYLAADKFLGWFQDLSDELGLRQDRRTFLARQVEIYQSSSLEEMWERILAASHQLGMDFAEIKVFDGKDPLTQRQVCLWDARQGQDPSERFDPARAMYISLPLGQGEHKLGLLCLAKDLSGKPLSRHVLRRVEHLRRTVGDTLLRLREKELSKEAQKEPVPNAGSAG